jgi:hypothetical protein
LTESPDHRASLFQQLPEDAAVAAVFMFAVATDGKVRSSRKRGQQVEHLAGVGAIHFATVQARKAVPIGLNGRCLSLRLQLRAGRQVGQPDIVVIAAGELGFGCAARRPPHGTVAQSFIRLPSSERPARLNVMSNSSSKWNSRKYSSSSFMKIGASLPSVLSHTSFFSILVPDWVIVPAMGYKMPEPLQQALGRELDGREAL